MVARSECKPYRPSQGRRGRQRRATEDSDTSSDILPMAAANLVADDAADRAGE
jgi:hypothetical protein